MHSTQPADQDNVSFSRRDFARRSILTAAGVAAIGNVPSLLAQGAVTDVDIVQFALNLEYLEAEFYTVAVTGKTLAQSGFNIGGTGRQGDTTGGAKVAFSNNLMAELAAQIARDEQMHVKVLQGALGSAAIAKPSINLEALTIGFRSQTEFLILARAFEDVGVTAYGGAAPLIRDKNILAVAARIALTEAQHAGVLRYVVAQNNIAVPQVDGSDVPPLGSPNGRLFQLDDQGLSTVRTTSQVLSIVLGGGTTRGGFFPDGVNGNINRV